MRLTIRWIAALALPVMLLTGSLVDAQKKPNPDKDLDKDKMVKAGTVMGKVMNVYEDKKKVRIQVTIQVLDPAGVQRLAQAKLEMARAGDANAYRNAQNSLLQAQRSLYKNETKEVEVQAADDVVVRMARPKEDFDEKGRLKKYTKKELEELRGTDKKLPGYKADFGDITTDQIIQISLVRKKGSPVVPKLPKKGKGKDADDAAVADLIAENAPQASLIVIVREPAPPPKGK
jgi:hypothetical protein